MPAIHRSRSILLFALLLWMLVPTASPQADELMLRDGSRLLGEVTARRTGCWNSKQATRA